ncbi:MAG: DUF2065 domain-containing protein [Pseudooceanicola sp.]|nr:DUF2065 domain-containing protein [Pseudooceanicola sp.]
MGKVLTALGLVLILEGALWALAPGSVEKMLQALRDLPEAARRQLGALAVISGLILLWFARALGG